MGTMMKDLTRTVALAMVGIVSLIALAAQEEDSVQRQQQGCPTVRIESRRLADLQIPRAGHHAFWVGNEMIVIGGHTSGFVLTPTAEHYVDGEWQLQPTVYSHDHGLATRMSSGKLLIAGGHEKDLGIGQLFSVEVYDPVSKSFEGCGALDTKRCFADALELDSGKVLVTGNWFEDDAIEQYCGNILFSPVKAVSQQRAVPYILRTAEDNAIIFSSCNQRDEPHDTILIDRLKGDPFTTPLFDSWHPFNNKSMWHSADCFIGDEVQGRYVSLFPVADSCGQVAIAQADGEQISLLPTDYPVPMQSQWGDICYFTTVIADRQAQRAYLVGEVLQEERFVVLAIDYQVCPAALTLYYTDSQPGVGHHAPVLTPDGNLVIAGGVGDSNFAPYASVLLLCIHPDTVCQASSWWLLALVVFLVIAVIVGTAYYFIRWRRHHGRGDSPLAAQAGGEELAAGNHEVLISDICRLMEEEHLYQRSELKVGDLAQVLGISSRNISDSIKTTQGCSFAQFVNVYRVEHAKRLLRRSPDIKMTAVYVDSGFANETSFFRTFKAVTGMTPREWALQND